MATNYSTTDNGNNTAIIVLAMIIIAALAIGAIYLINYNSTPVQNTNTTERYVNRVEQAPAQAGQAISRTVNTPAQNAQSPATDQTPAPSQPESNPAPQQ